MNLKTESSNSAGGRLAAGAVDPAVEAFEVPTRESSVPAMDDGVEATGTETVPAGGDAGTAEAEKGSAEKRSGRRRHRSRHGHRRHGHGSGHRKRSDMRAVRPRGRRWYFRVALQLASMALLGVAVYLMCIDSGLRKPGTEDTPGDPPTHYFYGSLLAGGGSMVLFVGSLRRRKQRRRSFGLLAATRSNQGNSGAARGTPGMAGSALRAALRPRPDSPGRGRDEPQALGAVNLREGDSVKRLLDERWEDLSPEARRLIGIIVRESVSESREGQPL